MFLNCTRLSLDCNIIQLYIRDTHHVKYFISYPTFLPSKFTNNLMKIIFWSILEYLGGCFTRTVFQMAGWPRKKLGTHVVLNLIPLHKWSEIRESVQEKEGMGRALASFQFLSWSTRQVGQTLSHLKQIVILAAPTGSYGSHNICCYGAREKQRGRCALEMLCLPDHICLCFLQDRR